MEVSDETVLLGLTDRPDLVACIHITNFSCCDKLIRVTDLVLRLMRNLKILKAKELKEGTICQGEVTVEGKASAETR